MNTAFSVNLLGLVVAIAGCALAATASRRLRGGEASQAAPSGPGLWRRLVAPLAVRLRPDDPNALADLTIELSRAARRGRDAVDRYLEERVLCLVCGLGCALITVAVVDDAPGMLIACSAILAGLRGPAWLLDRRGRERRDVISLGLATAVDLLMTCVRAGLSLEHALAQVARNLSSAHPELADELGLTGSEIDAGVPMPDALRRLSARVGLDDLSALCGVIAQAAGLGAPVADTLEEYAEASRRQRMSLLEERAGKVAAKLTIPLAMFFLPAAMLVILGPAAIQLVRALQ